MFGSAIKRDRQLILPVSLYMDMCFKYILRNDDNSRFSCKIIKLLESYK